MYLNRQLHPKLLVKFYVSVVLRQSANPHPVVHALLQGSTDRPLSLRPGHKSMAAKTWRLELFFKSDAELRGKVIPFLKSSTVQRVNITNKAKGDGLLEAVQTLKSELPDLDICVHFSCKWNYERTVEASFGRLQALAQELSLVPGTSLLLVSGGGKKKALDSLKALELAAQRSTLFQQLNLPFYVAFNPYLPDPRDQEEERARLRSKVLESKGLVRGVYLQMGSDVGRLRQGLQFLRRLQSEVSGGGCEREDCGSTEDGGKIGQAGNVGGGGSGSGQQHKENSRQEPLQLLGSIFIPSRRLLAQMKFRPWNGVFLSEEYLGSVEGSEAITKQLLEVYAEHGVIPLVESAVRNEEELGRASELLGVVSANCTTWK